MIEYVPIIRDKPKLINVVSAWYNIPTILKDIILRFNIKNDLALEFGVERGYSTTALAYYFKKVIGVDTFKNNTRILDLNRLSEFQYVKELLKEYKNVELIESLFEDYIKQDNLGNFDIIHIDIIHEYEPTYMCGDWSLQHSNCVIFHDTMSFSAVMHAVTDLSIKNNFEFYNYPYDNGLGILIKK
jgi:predicted O-methyltransferase YrrM